MIDHIGIAVSDLKRAKAFYETALAPLSYVLIMEVEGYAGFGRDGKPDFWIHQGGRTVPRVHVAFRADNRARVREFHTAALRAGAKDHGAPGVREAYHPSYYGAFVLDPDGHNVEAVCHDPE